MAELITNPVKEMRWLRALLMDRYGVDPGLKLVREVVDVISQEQKVAVSADVLNGFLKELRPLKAANEFEGYVQSQYQLQTQQKESNNGDQEEE